jgi:glycosyltransferase involved in cell wall biosynthesis
VKSADEAARDDGRAGACGRGPVVVISANSCWNIVNFRSALVTALVREGKRVVVIAPPDEHSPALAGLGAEFLPIDIASSSLSVRRDLKLLARYTAIMRSLRPSAFLGFTIKPNIYGSLAAQSVGARVINNITGLGTAFLSSGWLKTLASSMYRVALRRSHTVFFQNQADMALFLDRRLVRQDQARLLPGSGINLDRFKPAAAAGGADAAADFRFLLIGRLLWDKGVGEYVEAARQVRATHPQARFQLLGPLGADNRTAVSAGQLAQWLGEGNVDYLGGTDDVRPFVEAADCLVLPSYREGLPRSLLEGSAMGKPVIATDVPGCRDVVDHGRTGLLCAVRSPAALAGAMRQMLELPPAERARMGARGRERVEQEFCESMVLERYLGALSA